MKHILALLLLLAWPVGIGAQSIITLAGSPPAAAAGPVLVSATVAANGTDVTLVWDEAATRGAGYATGDINIDNTSAGDNVSWTYASGDGSTTWVGSISGATIFVWKTPNIDFNGNANSVEDGGGVDAASFTSSAMVNNSTQTGAVIYQNFETATTGYDNSETWTPTTSGTGTVDPVNATSPAPLIGTQSGRFTTATGTAFITSPTFTAAPEAWGYMRFRPVTVQAGNRNWIIGQNSTTDLMVIRRNTAGTLRVAHGTATATTVGTVSAGTTIHLWWYFKTLNLQRQLFALLVNSCLLCLYHLLYVNVFFLKHLLPVVQGFLLLIQQPQPLALIAERLSDYPVRCGRAPLVFGSAGHKTGTNSKERRRCAYGKRRKLPSGDADKVFNVRPPTGTLRERVKVFSCEHLRRLAHLVHLIGSHAGNIANHFDSAGHLVECVPSRNAFVTQLCNL